MPNSELAQIAADHWDAFLATHPVQGTAIGDQRYADRLSPVSPDQRGALMERFDALAQRLQRIDAAALDAEDALTRSSLEHALQTERTLLAADTATYTVDAMNGLPTALLNIPSIQPLRTPEEGAALLARWRAMGPWVDEVVAALRRGAAEGRTPVASGVRRVIAQLDELLGQPVSAWPLNEPLARDHAAWPPDAWQRFASGLEATVAQEIRPALARYRTYLADEALATARDDAHVGIGALPGGVALYARLAGVHTTTEMSAERIHEIGLAEVARVDAALTELGARALGTGSLAETLRSLRGNHALFFSTGDEVRSVAERSLRAAEAAVPRWFGRVPRTPCVVVEMPPHEQEHSTVAYYREPAADGSRPGSYYINTSAPETRTRYEAEALAFHESVPGHHLQIAIGQELTGLPTFRRHAEVTAFVEGWGLYAEGLAEEMGLYSGDLDRIGMLSQDGWRACRLVVDTGMHAMGWSRSAAIAFMTEHTALAANNIANEVDRYIAWPGQALAYKIGQLEIRRLREDAARALGGGFDIRTFHDALLGHGALPLGTLREAVARDLDLALPA